MTSKSQKILGAISKLQFFVQWFLNKQNNSHFIDALVIVEALKFYYRMQCLFTSDAVYIENAIQKQEQDDRGITLPANAPSTIANLDNLLEKLKNKSYMAKQNQGMTELISSGKKISLQSVIPISNKLSLKKLSYREITGELLHLLRPLAYIIAIKIFGTKNYKAWSIALIIDLIRWLIQSKMAFRTVQQSTQLSQRKRNMVSKALFRPPFYENIFKPKVIKPIMDRFLSCDRWIYKIIMYILQMRSSITLTI